MKDHLLDTPGYFVTHSLVLSIGNPLLKDVRYELRFTLLLVENVDGNRSVKLSSGRLLLEQDEAIYNRLLTYLSGLIKDYLQFPIPDGATDLRQLKAVLMVVVETK